MRSKIFIAAAGALVSLTASPIPLDSITSWSSSHSGETYKLRDAFYTFHGEWEGTKNYWKSFTEPRAGDEPGVFTDSGRVSTWIPINSKSFAEGKEFQWVGYKSNAEKWTLIYDEDSGKVVEKNIGDWGVQIDSADPGVYLPTWRDGAEGAYTIIHEGLGEMAYENAVEPAQRVGDEHLWIRTGWAAVGDKMRSEDNEDYISMARDRHEILSHSWDNSSAEERWRLFEVGDTIAIEDFSVPQELRGLVVGDLHWGYGKELEISVPYPGYSEGGDPTKGGTKVFTSTYQVTQEYAKVDSVMEDAFNGEYFITFYRGEIMPNASSEEGKPQLRVKCSPAWDKASQEINMKATKSYLDRKIYDNVDIWYIIQRQAEFFAYPSDDYSLKTHAALASYGYVGAKGGSFCGVTNAADIVNPFLLNYDKFYMMDSKGELEYPDNPYQYVGLKKGVERAVRTKGSFVRTMSSVEDVDYWNCGGRCGNAEPDWWGGISRSNYKEHFVYLDELRENLKIAIYTPSELVKYQKTRESILSITEKSSKEEFEVIKTISFEVDSSLCPEEYRTSVSVIVKFEEPYFGGLYVRFPNVNEERLPGSKLDADGEVWSFQMNPYENGGVCDIEIERDIKISDMGHVNNEYLFSLSKNALALSLPAGNYKAELFTVNGKQIASVDVTGMNRMTPTGISTKDLAAGVFLIKVRNGNKVVLQDRFIVK